MEQQHRDILRRNRLFLKDNIIMAHFIDYVAELLTSDLEEDIKSKRTNHEQVVCFLNILERRGNEAFKIFLDALEKAEHRHVKEQLMIEDDAGEDCVDGPIQQETRKVTAITGSSPARHDWLKDLKPQQREAVITERTMAFVAREVHDLIDLGKIMGFREGRLRQYQASSPLVNTQVSSMFSAWRCKMGSQATVEKFVRLLQEAKFDDIYVEEIIKKEYPPDDSSV